MIEIKRIDDTSREWARKAFLKWWTVPYVVSREKRLYFDGMPGFVAFLDGEPSGLLTYDIIGPEFEVANINAPRFYQRVGMKVGAWRIGEMEVSRKMKPEIPLEQDGIPIRDEVVMELILET